MRLLKKTTTSFGRFLTSDRCFWVIIAIFVLQALWIACSGRYPMAFDEDFHLGIIRLYAHHLSPFWSGQPAGADAFGAVARDPSYLFQYVMSFPYRLISAFTGDQTVQVLLLRFINIGLFAASLPLYRRLLLKTKASHGLVHGCFLLFVLIPIVPLLAAQINYDNLFLPLTGLTLLLTVTLSQRLHREGRLDVRLLGWLLVTCLLASLVKYAFLPIFVTLAIFVTVDIYRTTKRPLLSRLGRSLRDISLRPALLLVAVLLLSLGLFGERYGVNLVRYHTPVPDCDQVLTVQQCSAYGPWIRNYRDAQKKVNAPRSPITFTADWFYGMWLRTFFAVDGPGTNFQTRGPLFMPAVSAIVGSAIALLALVVCWRAIWRRYDKTLLIFLSLVIVVYTLTLWLDEYHSFLQAGQPVAINGRYLIPIFLPLMLLLALGWQQLLVRRQQLVISVFLIFLLCFVDGGGTLTYILRSNDAWYWPSNAVAHANHALQRTIGPVVPGSHRPTAFLK